MTSWPTSSALATTPVTRCTATPPPRPIGASISMSVRTLDWQARMQPSLSSWAVSGESAKSMSGRILPLTSLVLQLPQVPTRQLCG